jgi:hypothetical protein
MSSAGCSAAALLCCCASLGAQYFKEYSLGARRLLVVPTARATLAERLPLRIALRTPSYLLAVGGVVFEAKAELAPGFRTRQLDIHYDHSQPDGRRLGVTIDGGKLVAPIYDWQLVPIARFADSEHTAAFSLFGRPEDLGDEKAASDVGGNGGVILKYHEAFKDTLVGLRLFQLDILIGFEDATDLPGYRGYYMLGRGETVPDHAANVLAFSNLDAVCLSFAPSGRNSAFHSYVIHDAKSKVTISSRGAYLHLTGQPRYHTFHFGRSRSDPPLPNWRLNRWLSRNIPAVRNINPAVWDTATNVMRYAAFFRYAKAANEQGWRSFIARLEATQPRPAVDTPAVFR